MWQRAVKSSGGGETVSIKSYTSTFSVTANASKTITVPNATDIYGLFVKRTDLDSKCVSYAFNSSDVWSAQFGNTSSVTCTNNRNGSFTFKYDASVSWNFTAIYVE